jgi:hypothetical protein
VPKPSPTRYRTTNWTDDNAVLRKRGSLSVWFGPEMVWHADKTGKRGRPETFSDAAIQTCLTLKVLFGLPLRQTVGLIGSLIQMAGLDWPVPDYSDVVPPAGADCGTGPVSRLGAAAEPVDRQHRYQAGVMVSGWPQAWRVAPQAMA